MKLYLIKYLKKKNEIFTNHQVNLSEHSFRSYLKEFFQHYEEEGINFRTFTFLNASRDNVLISDKYVISTTKSIDIENTQNYIETELLIDKK